MEIHNPEHWRVSMSGFSIRTGWSDEKKLIAACPYQTPTREQYQEWLKNAELICELHNKAMEDTHE